MKISLPRFPPGWTPPLLGLTLLLLWILMVGWPIWQQLSVQKEQLATLQTQIATGVAARAGLMPLRSQVAQHQIEVTAFEQKVPRLETLPVLVKQLGSLAQQTGVSLQQLNRSVERDATTGVVTTRITVVAGGRLNPVYAFWRALLAQSRYLNLAQPTLQLGPDGRLEGRFQVLAYSMPR